MYTSRTIAPPRNVVWKRHSMHLERSTAAAFSAARTGGISALIRSSPRSNVAGTRSGSLPDAAPYMTKLTLTPSGSCQTRKFARCRNRRGGDACTSTASGNSQTAPSSPVTRSTFARSSSS